MSRAPRDPVSAALVKELNDEWRAGLIGIFRKARKDRSLRIDVDPRAAADLVLSAIQGFVTSVEISTSEIRRSLHALEQCLASA
jgi:hypothetical protein